MSAIPSTTPVQAPPPIRVEPKAPLPRRGSPWKWLFLIALVLIGAYVAYRATRPQPQAPKPVASIPTAKIRLGTLERTTRIAGVTSAKNYINITAPRLRGPESRGNLVLLKLTPSGTSVKKGDVVAQIDPQSALDHIDDVTDTVETAEADVRKRQAEQSVEWENLQQTMRVAKSELDKARIDYSAAEVRTDIERQLLKLALDEAEAKYNQLQKDLASKRISQRAELRVLELTRERHKRHLGRHQADLQKFTMRAPMDGLMVVQVNFRGGDFSPFQEGDQVYPGMIFAKIVDPTSMQVETLINQTESGEIRIGQTAGAHFDAFAGLTLPAKVYSIGALASGGWRQNFYIRNILVRANLDSLDPRVIPDLSASLDVVLARAENKPLVPLAAVTAANGKHFVYVKTGETFEKRQVELGLENNRQAVVLAGLRPGDEVRLN